MISLKHFPAPPLSEVVQLFWYHEHETAVPSASLREAILPDGCAHLVFNLSENRIGFYERIGSDRLTTLGGSIFCGPRSSAYAIIPGAAVVIGVLFRPGGVFRLLSGSAEEFRNAQVPLELVIGGEALRHELIAAPTPAAKFLLLEKFLVRQLRPSLSLHRAVRYAVGAFEQDAFLSVAAVLQTIGLSERRFSRIFSEQVGLTPKLFQRVRRFQRTMASLPSHGRVDWAGTATGNGYYDQAHLINDFRAFSSLTPSDFFASRIVQR
ncbi:MAG TPA: helix-turn-helix domain-containing protein, partial [Chthoniobacterales bacterium]